MRAQLAQQHRFEHTIRVARLADTLAQAHGLDARAARTAGLLHDLARLYPADRLIRECAVRSMPIDAFERTNPIVLHARLGAELARELFGVVDPAVLSAIAKHTVAAAEMSPLDCVVYLADGLEPGRNFPERAALAALAGRDLSGAMRATLEASMRYLQKQGMAVAPQTLEAGRTFGISEEVFHCPN
ncbi:MAG: bis(5'-nucleosyl)-tetraphosphatase (symmetrical) YqeK [Candidatus Eremiobacteraeota bacterium]|nr:bis(5'-nucleosyl)-tetraphosphatase (symmetrical) YqeK [Candidatus Eremiobacteraeota bacterium]